MANSYYNRLTEVAPRQPGYITEQRGYRPRNPITEKISRLDWERMAYDRTTPLPTDTVPLPQLLEFFGKAFILEHCDRLGIPVKEIR